MGALFDSVVLGVPVGSECTEYVDDPMMTVAGQVSEAMSVIVVDGYAELRRESAWAHNDWIRS